MWLTTIILNSFSVSLIISSLFIWTCVFLTCSFICAVFLSSNFPPYLTLYEFSFSKALGLYSFFVLVFAFGWKGFLSLGWLLSTGSCACVLVRRGFFFLFFVFFFLMGGAICGGMFWSVCGTPVCWWLLCVFVLLVFCVKCPAVDTVSRCVISSFV